MTKKTDILLGLGSVKNIGLVPWQDYTVLTPRAKYDLFGFDTDVIEQPLEKKSPAVTFVRDTPKIGGSGKKYKKCCLH